MSKNGIEQQVYNVLLTTYTQRSAVVQLQKYEYAKILFPKHNYIYLHVLKVYICMCIYAYSLQYVFVN